jgi:hypothetical protein
LLIRATDVAPSELVKLIAEPLLTVAVRETVPNPVLFVVVVIPPDVPTVRF